VEPVRLQGREIARTREDEQKPSVGAECHEESPTSGEATKRCGEKGKGKLSLKKIVAGEKRKMGGSRHKKSFRHDLEMQVILVILRTRRRGYPRDEAKGKGGSLYGKKGSVPMKLVNWKSTRRRENSLRREKQKRAPVPFHPGQVYEKAGSAIVKSVCHARSKDQ